jgi:uncharacterized membrane protein
MENPDHDTMEKWRKDPNNWKFGLFYYNPEDLRIFPPKRIKWMGMTINFANPKSVVVFTLFLLFVIIMLLYFPTKKH